MSHTGVRTGYGSYHWQVLDRNLCVRYSFVGTILCGSCHSDSIGSEVLVHHIIMIRDVRMDSGLDGVVDDWYLSYVSISITVEKHI